MDIATIIGILGGFGMLFGAILLEGSSPLSFLNLLAAVVVIGGGSMAVLARYPLNSFLHGAGGGLKSAILYKATSPTKLIDQLSEIADTMRRHGPIALEQVEVDDPFLKRGVRMIADGFSAEALRTSLERERDLDYERVHHGHVVWKAFGEAAPGLGMVGTLIGLVSMFGHMDDPKKIGPGMAIALLTTLYGAVFANVLCLPIADKLAHRAEEEGTNRSLVIEALVMIREGKNPATIRDELASYLPLHTRQKMQEAA
ncbi:MAG: MotA/TolQ/ExbB proton channel family protein [Devosia sp.]